MCILFVVFFVILFFVVFVLVQQDVVIYDVDVVMVCLFVVIDDGQCWVCIGQVLDGCMVVFGGVSMVGMM